MTDSDKSIIELRADEVQIGDDFNSHQDVFWEVTGIELGRRLPDDVTIHCVHDRAWTYAADQSVKVMR